MSTITSRLIARRQLLKGKGWCFPYLTTAGTTTAAGATSGHNTIQIAPNSIGSTLPGTLQPFPLPPSNAGPLRLITVNFGATNTIAGYLAIFYKIGTIDLTGTGNKLTHDAATFPILRTLFGAASPLSLLPVLRVDTALTTTAAALTISNVANTQGYVNEDGATVVGTKTFTFPSATTAAGSAFVLPLNDGDSAVRDIQQINVTVASATGAATLWGVELLAPHSVPTGVSNSVLDALVGGPTMHDLVAGAATTGTASSLLARLYTSTAAARIEFGTFVAAMDP